MANENSSAKAVLTISPCKVSSGKRSVDGSRPVFEAMINPSGYEHTFRLEYSKKKVLGLPGTETKYNASNPEKIVLKELIKLSFLFKVMFFTD